MARGDRNGTSGGMVETHTHTIERSVSDASAWAAAAGKLAEAPGGVALLSAIEMRTASSEVAALWKSTALDLHAALGGATGRLNGAYEQLHKANEQLATQQSLGREALQFVKNHPALLVSVLGFVSLLLPNKAGKGPDGKDIPSIREQAQQYIAWLGQQIQAAPQEEGETEHGHEEG